MEQKLQGPVALTLKILGAFLLVELCCMGTLYGLARLYQFRAERLRGRIASIRVGHTTFDEARRLASDYKRYLGTAAKSCSAADCTFSIRLTNYPFPAMSDVKPLREMGVRPTVVVATVKVKDDVVSHVDFGLLSQTQDGRPLEGSFHAAGELTMFDKCRDGRLGRDSRYAVRGATNVAEISVAFASAATTEQIASATDIRLDCITRIPGCGTAIDLMPRALEGVSLQDDSDKSFESECAAYMKEQESNQGPFPWELDTAFSGTPTTVNLWVLTRSPR